MDYSRSRPPGTALRHAPARYPGRRAGHKRSSRPCRVCRGEPRILPNRIPSGKPRPSFFSVGAIFVTDEQSFLAAVAAYKKSPSKTGAIDIWGVFFGPSATKPLRIDQLTRESLRVAVESMRASKEDRDATYGGMNPFKAIARIATSTASLTPTVTRISSSGSYLRPRRFFRKSEMAARSSRRPLLGV